MTELIPLESSFFDSITGLPLHPLVVHAAVVVLPLSAVALIVIVAVPAWRQRFGWLTMAGLAAGTVAAFVAKESGEALATHVGLPADHARWGDLLPSVAVVLFAVAALWFVLQRRAAQGSTRSVAVLVTGIVSAILAAVSVVMTVVVGHSGAQAVWEGSITPEPTASATAAVTSYSLDQVKGHATAADCWTAINGTVYNLTTWEGRHPGGQQPIVTLCGTDGTAAFLAQHKSDKKPTQALTEFAIGTLSGSQPTASATPTATTSTASPAPTTTPSASGYAMAVVKQHSTASSCWSVVDGSVYDLTDWVASHPGGRARILSMCGKDGTGVFHGEHGKEAQPNKILNGFKIGALT